MCCSHNYATRRNSQGLTVWQPPLAPESIITAELRNVPDELRLLDRWGLWRMESANGRDKPTKVPFRGVFGRKAKSTDRTDWTKFAIACRHLRLAAVKVRPGQPTVEGGLGFAFFRDDGLTGIDLDKCRVPATGVIADWAQEIIDGFGSYTEVSPSGTGVKIWCIGTVQKSCPGRQYLDGKKIPAGGKIEIFSTERYFTFTGKKLPGCSSELQDCQAKLDALLPRIEDPTEPAKPAAIADAATGQPSPCPLTDEELIAKIRGQKNKFGESFSRLWAGDDSGFPSRSEADWALFKELACWLGNDVKRIERLAWQSKLARDKWSDPCRGVGGNVPLIRYGVLKAIAKQTHVKEWPQVAARQQDKSECPDLGQGPKKDHSPRSGHRELLLTGAQESAIENYYAMEARRAAGEDVRLTPADDDRLLPEFVTRTVLRPTGKTELVVIKNRQVERPIMAGVVEVIRGQYATRIDPDWGDCRRVPDAFFKVAEPTNHACICFACQNRSCEDCGRIWLRDNVLHFSKTIGQWTPIFMYTADEAETEKIKKRIQRAKLADECGQDQPLHVNVPIANDKRLWFSNAEAKGFVRVSQDVACKLLCDAIEGILPVRDENGTIIKAGETRDIGKSRGLELCKPKAPSSGKWRRVPQQGKRVPISFEDTRQAVAEIAGITEDRDWYKFGQRWLKYQDDEEHTLTYQIMAKLKEEYSPPCRLNVTVGQSREQTPEYLPQKWLPKVLQDVLN